MKHFFTTFLALGLTAPVHAKDYVLVSQAKKTKIEYTVKAVDLMSTSGVSSTLSAISDLSFSDLTNLDKAQEKLDDSLSKRYEGQQKRVVGTLTTAGKKELSGFASFSDEENFSDLVGGITLKVSDFSTGSSGRDDHVKEMMSGNIEIDLVKVEKYEPKKKKVHLLVDVLWNGVKKRDLKSRGTLKFSKTKNSAQIKGTLVLNRKSFNIKPLSSLGHKVSDSAISKKVILKYTLPFKAKR